MIPQCIYKERFKYFPCKDCSGKAVTCRNYQSELKYEGHKSRKSLEAKERRVDFCLIRVFNDGGVYYKVSSANRVEVIGNIYENPKLLKETK